MKFKLNHTIFKKRIIILYIIDGIFKFHNWIKNIMFIFYFNIFKFLNFLFLFLISNQMFNELVWSSNI